MKSKQWIAATVVLAGIAACNYTVGDCWPVGQGDSTGDVGSGVINSTGPGNPGEGPTGQAQGALSGDQCNDPEQSSSGGGGSVEAGLKVFCPKSNWGVACSKECFAKKVPCVSHAEHPYKKIDGGIGQLFSCNDLALGFMCGYHYPNGDDCYYAFMNPFPTVCSYSGNN